VLDREQILDSLARHNNLIAHVAKDLGLSRQALYRRIKELGIERPSRRK